MASLAPSLRADPGNIPRCTGHSDARMAVDTDAHVLVIALVDGFHLALADGAKRDASFVMSTVGLR